MEAMDYVDINQRNRAKEGIMRQTELIKIQNSL